MAEKKKEKKVVFRFCNLYSKECTQERAREWLYLGV